MITLIRYTKDKLAQWNAFVASSKNGTFMLMRDYLEYHSERFVDSSLMCYEDGHLVAVLPASLHNDELRSHGGLTYGGLIVNREMTVSRELKIFDAVRLYLRNEGLSRLIYKRVPAIYYSYPADEDLYALFRCGAALIRRDIALTIDLTDRIGFSSVRRRMIRKAQKADLKVCESNDFRQYIDLLTEVLTVHHNARPPHSADELKLLASRFPDVIKLFCAFENEKMLAGVLIFDTPQVVHTQYIANSEDGRRVGALDIVMDYLINDYSRDKRYFDFGIATENDGKFLNEGLTAQKEMFGGRGVAYDFYELLAK